MIFFLIGCHSSIEKFDTAEETTPTYYQDIAPLLYNSCSGCHREDGLNPNLLFLTAESAIQLAPVLNAAMQAERMPPFMARESEECENPWGFLHDPRLSSSQKEMMQAWIDAGTPLGDEASATALTEPSSHNLDGDLQILTPAGGYTTNPIGNTKDEFICYSLNPNQSGWLEAFEVLPDNASVVHHVLVGIDNEGESASIADADSRYPCFGGFGVSNVTFVGGWVPGASPTQMPEHSAVNVPEGARIVLQMHYHLVETAEQDQTGIALQWAEAPPIRQSYFALMGNSHFAIDAENGLVTTSEDQTFLIPAGAENHTETMHYKLFETLSRGIDIFLVANHMHYVGERMRMWIEGESDFCLLDTPEWDFNWQQSYFYDANNQNNPTVSPGDQLWISCTYNNSLSNSNLVDALLENNLSEPIPVGLGEGSLDEMCLGIFGFTPQLTYKHENPTHAGSLEVSISAGSFFSAECLGVASIQEEANIEANAACGLVLQENLISLEFSLRNDVFTIKIPLVQEEPQEMDWTITSEGDHRTLSFEGNVTTQQGTFWVEGTADLTPQ